MSSVENRIVNLQMNNTQFEAGAKQSLNTLDALNKSLKMEGATKGLDDLDNASKKLNFGPIGSAIESIADKFKTLSIIGITALTNIVNKAVDAGTSLLHSLTLAPIMDGFHEYETNLNSIQTILANTGLEGAAGLAKVNAALDELNHYADQTIYNFSEMARNIGTFTAAGVKLDVATAAIKGIANLAAVSGSNAEQASSAMYQLSQALAAGKVSLEDWNSVVQAGMGGKLFQDALIETARVHGVAIDKMIKDEGSFRLTLQKGWLTSSILTETLSKFTGDLTAAQLKTMGYNDQQIAGILKLGATAKAAATEVKTFSQLIGTLQEAVGSGWSQTFQILFGDFEEAKTLFTEVSNVLGGFVNASSDARNHVLKDFKDLGGRTTLIYAIKNAFEAVISVIKPVKQAFRQIFPATTGKQLFDIVNAIRNFTENLAISGETADKIQRTFAGLFAVISIGWDIVKELTKVIFDLLGMATDGAGGILDFTANIGDFLVMMKIAIEQGNGLTRFFQNLEKILKVPIKLLQMAGEAIGKLFDKFDGTDAASKVTGLVGKLSPMTKIADAIINAWTKVPGLVGDAWDALWPFAEKIGKFFQNLGAAIQDYTKNINFDLLFKGLATGGFTAVLFSITSLINKIKGAFGGGEEKGGGFLDGVKDTLEEVTNTLKSMQNTLRAATLLEIAAAIGLLTISIVALAKVDAAGLTRSLTAMSVMFAQLAGSLYAFEKVASDKSIVRMIGLGAALILLASAVDILASAVVKMAALDWNGLAKGLTGVVGVLLAMVATVELMPNEGKLIGTSVALILLASAVKILASAVTDLSGLSWEEMAKGLLGVGATLAALTLFTKFAEADKGGVLQGAGLILLAAGIKVLASALTDLGQMKWDAIVRGLAAMAGGLGLMAGALYALPPSSILSAAAILIVASSLSIIGDAMAAMGKMNNEQVAKGLILLAGALTYIAAALMLIPPQSVLSAAAVLVVAASLEIIGNALAKMSKMSWEEIVKGLTELAGALLIISGAMYLMEGALPGAAALIVVAASLAILAPILSMFGQMSWEEIVKGLVLLAGALTVIGVAGLVLTPVIPTLLGLGVAVTLLGVGMLAAGAGVLAFSAGLAALSIASVAGTAALVGMVAALAGLIPQVLTQVALGIAAFAKTIAISGPAITGAMVTVLMSMLNAIEVTSPKIISTLGDLMVRMLDALLKYLPKLQDTGYKLLIALLNGVANNMGGVITAATNVVVAFINGVSANQPRIIQAGVNFIINYINGLASAIRDNSARMGDAGSNLGLAIVEGMARGISSGAGKVIDAARNAAKRALEAAKNFLDINSPSKKFIEVGESTTEGMAVGIDRSVSMVVKSTEAVGQAAIDAMKNSLMSMSTLVDDNINANPIITPVLDLTNLKANAGQIDKVISGMKDISLNRSISNVSATSNAIQQTQNDRAAITDSTTTQPLVQFTQNNTSPKPLNAADIYRQTNNQLSQVKGALDAANAK